MSAPEHPRFALGVASGDPATDAVSLWTAVDGADGAVRWQVALDASFETIVREGEVDPDPVPPTVNVRVDGLEPGTRLRYRFAVDRRDGTVEHSAIGTTATLPAEAERFAIGLASCARLVTAPFTPYRHLAERDLDLVVHLGDYVYEHPHPRHVPSGRCLHEEQYRARYRQYRGDPSLQAAHAAAPWINVWDDHEVADDAWRHGGPADLDEVPVDWPQRHENARRAFFDWVPQDPTGDGPTEMDRRLRVGGLVDVVLVDARHAGRSRPVRTAGPALVDPDDDRRILAPEQWDWLEGCVADAAHDGTWLVLGTPVQASPLHLARLPGPRRRLRSTPLVNPGQWDGYPVEQRRLASLLQPVAGRALICSGDLHAGFVTSLDVGRGRPIPEVTVPSIASVPFAESVGDALPVPVPAGALGRWLRHLNPHIESLDLTGRGSAWLDVRRDHLDVAFVDDTGSTTSTWRLDAGGDGLRPIT
ncbi:alkaline phosphatase D family protein [Ilumatobacter sp.]|uniref:alkaline phosphatase D family protein n=1 Tax=Ilumatobacter sp. TaxID=1967498 RepID=UPI003B528F2A